MLMVGSRYLLQLSLTKRHLLRVKQQDCSLFRPRLLSKRKEMEEMIRQQFEEEHRQAQEMAQSLFSLDQFSLFSEGVLVELSCVKEKFSSFCLRLAQNWIPKRRCSSADLETPFRSLLTPVRTKSLSWEIGHSAIRIFPLSRISFQDYELFHGIMFRIDEQKMLTTRL
jgi:hypothetical protein